MSKKNEAAGINAPPLFLLIWLALPIFPDRKSPIKIIYSS